MTRHKFVFWFFIAMMVLCMVLSLATKGNQPNPNLLCVGYLFGMTMFGGIAIGMEIGKDVK